ncbi:MFS transporter [Nocardiopsis coralli]|uniref:MFS transporter n=1 Tax=Nocardiopsis coralli TaxID=2772213 RepID=UPI001F2B060F|nr:MFS transporter [Nocardiopsis coralli]
MHRTDTRRAGPREWAGLAVLGLPTVLLGLDMTVLHLALPSLSAELDPSPAQQLWIVDAYGFLIAGFLITMGTLGDRVGRRRLLMIGGVAFVGASVLAAYSTSAEMLILARAALGIAGATLMPSTLALISTTFHDPRQRALAIGWWATFFAGGMAAGPLVGGVLLELFWWGAAFLLAVPLIAVMLVAAPLLLPESRDPDAGRLDLVSVALSLAAVLPVVHGVKEAAKEGPGLTVAASLTAGVVFAVVFARRQRRLSSPLLDLDLFRNREFSVALAVMLAVLVGVGGTMFLVTQYLQLVEGLSPTVSGLWYGPPALMMMASAVAGPVLARRVRPGYVVAGVLALSAVGYALLALVEGPGDLPLVIGGFSLVYLGLGAIAALGTDLVVGSAPPARAGSASAMSETVQELGVAFGIALLGSLSAAVYQRTIAGAAGPGLEPEVADAVEGSLTGAASVSGQIPGQLWAQAQEAFVAGLNTVGVVGAVAVPVLAAVTAFALRHVPAGGEGPGDADAPSVDTGSPSGQGEPGVQVCGPSERR